MRFFIAIWMMCFYDLLAGHFGLPTNIDKTVGVFLIIGLLLTLLTDVRNLIKLEK